MADKFILDDEGHVVPAENLLAWGRWFETANVQRVVAHDQIGAVEISTVFLGLSHGVTDEGAHILWETMVFNGPHDGHTHRYTTRELAEEGHRGIVAMIRAGGLA
jgi:hypothetical protein